MTLGIGLAAAPASANLTPEQKAKVEQAKKTIIGWAADPAVIAAVREANAKGAPAISNAKWDEMSEKDPQVKSFVDSALSEKLRKWEASSGLNKLYVRDKTANLVGGSNKALLFNNSTRPQYKEGFKGAWVDDKVKPDPTTQKPSVQIAVPIKDGGNSIGVMNAAVTF